MASFPKLKDFNALVSKGSWLALLWLPYDTTHRDQIRAFFNILNQDLKRPELDWKQRRYAFNGIGTISLMDVIRRVFEIVDILKDCFKNARPGSMETVMPCVGSALQNFQSVLLRHRFDRELEEVRCNVTSRLTNPATQRMKGFPLFMASMVPTLCCTFGGLLQTEAYDALSIMFGKDHVTRNRFLLRSADELEAIASMIDVVSSQLPRNGPMLRAALADILVAIGSIVKASRLEIPFPRNGVMTTPIPEEIGAAAEKCFSSLLTFCARRDLFETLEIIHDSLSSALLVLPEFWASSQAMPLCHLLKTIWNVVRPCEKKRTISRSTLDGLCQALRNLVYIFRWGSKALDVAEAHLKDTIGSRFCKAALVENGNCQPRYPAITLLVVRTVVFALDNCDTPVEDNESVIRAHDRIMELFQNLVLLAGTTPGDYLFADVMTCNSCQVLRNLKCWWRSTLPCEVASAKLDYVVKHRSAWDPSYRSQYDACRNFRCKISLNLFRLAFDNAEIVRRYISTSVLKAVPEWVDMIESTFANTNYPASTPTWEECESYFHPSLSMCSTRTCCMSILNALLLELPPGAVRLDTVMTQVLFEVGARPDASAEDAWLAVIALARIVKDSPENWKLLQAFRHRDGMRLSDLCAKCLEAMDRKSGGTLPFPNWPNLVWGLEAMGVFQYAAADSDDDGNQALRQYSKHNDGPTRPIEDLLFVAASFVALEGWFCDEGHTAGLLFQMIGNYAANVAMSTTLPKDVRRCLEKAHYLSYDCLMMSQNEVCLSNLEITEMCFFALANLSAVPDSKFKSLLICDVAQMSFILLQLVDVFGDRQEDLRETMLDNLASLTARTAINSNVDRDGTRMQIKMVVAGLDAWLQRTHKLHLNLPESTFYPLLALRRLSRRLLLYRKSVVASIFENDLVWQVWEECDGITAFFDSKTTAWGD